MGRNRFVNRPNVRIFFAEVARHRRDQLLSQAPAPNAAVDVFDAYAKSLTDAESDVIQAEADGDWIDVAGELNAGEQTRLFTDVVKEARAGETMLMSPELIQPVRIKLYLKAWSFTLADGKTPAPITDGALRGLDTDTYREINQALDWHEANIEAERKARKNARATGIASPAISVLPSAVTGESSGFAN